MSKFPAPEIDAAPEASRPLLADVEKKLGRVPNVYKVLSNSPAALKGYSDLSGALLKGTISASTRERIALALAAVNGCDYCLTAHTFFGKNFFKFDDAEIDANRQGSSKDPKAAAAVRFAKAIADKRGEVAPAEIDAVRNAGYGDAEIVEIIAHVALNTLTNYVNKALDTQIDFPSIESDAA